MSIYDPLFGLGIVIVLGLACRLVADWARLPAIVLLLPVGFAAGAATDTVHPDVLFGNTFSAIVDVAVGLILVVTEKHELRVRTRTTPVDATARDTAIALVEADGTTPSPTAS